MYFREELIDLNLMLLVLDVQMVENLLFLDLSGVGIGVLTLEPRLP